MAANGTTIPIPLVENIPIDIYNPLPEDSRVKRKNPTSMLATISTHAQTFSPRPPPRPHPRPKHHQALATLRLREDMGAVIDIPQHIVDNATAEATLHNTKTLTIHNTQHRLHLSTPNTQTQSHSHTSSSFPPHYREANSEHITCEATDDGTTITYNANYVFVLHETRDMVIYNTYGHHAFESKEWEDRGWAHYKQAIKKACDNYADSDVDERCFLNRRKEVIFACSIGSFADFLARQCLQGLF